mmetsp:Transcript_62506/g.111071  ORF Transcript_62506/g.111071 Transcript_62506/m.111071 type:complete len:259 (+) Transcript_62506:72-848(+)
MPAPADTVEEWYRRCGKEVASIVFVLGFLLCMTCSAGGWDVTGAKGTSMKDTLCDKSREIPDGRGVFEHVCAAGGTERAFSGVHNDIDRNISNRGVYRCACCGTALFDSAAKYNSRSGWPSFYAPVSEAIGYRKDFLQQGSTEVHCKTCGAHLGHVFDDGPPPTGQRYCINSVCIFKHEGYILESNLHLPWVVNSYLLIFLLLGCCCGSCQLSRRGCKEYGTSTSSLEETDTDTITPEVRRSFAWEGRQVGLSEDSRR